MASRSTTAELETLRMRLQRTRWRLRTAAYGGPEWDAATAELEDLEAELLRRTPARGRRRPA